MMCTCCSAPLIVGLHRQQSSVAAAVAFWFGNAALNPAVLIFMFFVLGWKFTVLRLIFSIILVFGLSYALMVRRAFSWRTLGLLGIGVAVVGFIAGLIGMAWI